MVLAWLSALVEALPGLLKAASSSHLWDRSSRTSRLAWVRSNLGLIRGIAFIIRRTARVQMPQKCPECGSAKVAEIVYGYPSSDWDWEKDVDSGKVVLGGCCGIRSAVTAILASGMNP